MALWVVGVSRREGTSVCDAAKHRCVDRDNLLALMSGVYQMKLIVLLFGVIFPFFSFAQTRDQAISFVQLHKDDDFLFEEGYGSDCIFLIDTSNSGYSAVFVDLSKLKYPGAIAGRYVRYIGSGARWYEEGRKRVGGMDDRFDFAARSDQMAPRVAKALDLLIEGCGGKKVDTDLFK